ncbi:MAG: DUF1707 domain-containing protein [Streptosporangiaceae bacterium]|jgi:hypothetical protein
MGTADRNYYPPGDFRVSDTERDRALSELSEALQAGRITAGEFDQRSGQVLDARTGKELTVPLADLPPLDRVPAARATALERPQRIRAPRIVIGASIAATCFAAAAVSAAISSGPTLAQREFFQAMAARQGISVPLPPAQGFNWAGTIAPGVIALLLVVLIVFLSVTRTDRPGR